MFLFASGKGLVARGVVISAEPVARKPGIVRQTPRLSIAAKRVRLARHPLGHDELKHFTNWEDGQPEIELNFKLYRQATDKIAGISDAAIRFLERSAPI